MLQNSPRISRREALARSGGALAALALLDPRLFAAGEGGGAIAFLDQPPAPPIPIQNLLDWQGLDAWITPSERFFAVDHFGPVAVDAKAFRLEIGGRVARPRSYTLDEIKALPRREVVFALECSGNGGF